MAIVVRLDQERLPWTADGEWLDITPDAAGAWHVWVAMLLMSVRDRATSLHYHSWRGADALSYVLAGTHYTITPPPQEVVEHLAGAWRARLPRGRWLRLRRAVWSAPAEASEVRVTVADMTYDWHLVCWSLSGVVGVDLHLVSCYGLFANAPEAEPDAAPGRYNNA